MKEYSDRKQHLKRMPSGNLSSSEIKKIFQLYDKQNGQIKTCDLGSLIGALNLGPTDSEINHLKRLVDPFETGFFTVDAFEKVVSARVRDKETFRNLLQALKKVFKSKNFKHDPEKI
jgi:Ca2+-binding EF-hand superfamily protein